jgi:PPOX class probable F420-dependent enzyme
VFTMPGGPDPLHAEGDPMQPSDDVKAWFLEHGRVAMVATNRRNAGPNLTPYWYLWDGENFLISTSDSVAKVKTLRRDPNMSLCIDDPVSNLGLYVVVYGKGEILGPGEAAVETSLKLIKKYRYTDEASAQHWREINANNDRVMIVMHPEQWIWRDV